MARTKYDEAFGVCRMTWYNGEPSPMAQPVVVEVWRSAVEANGCEATKPQVRVSARLEIRVHVGGKWMAFGWAGQLADVEPGEIRRYAYMRSRYWRTTITLDGWGG